VEVPHLREANGRKEKKKWKSETVNGDGASTLDCSYGKAQDKGSYGVRRGF